MAASGQIDIRCFITPTNNRVFDAYERTRRYEFRCSSRDTQSYKEIAATVHAGCRAPRGREEGANRDPDGARSTPMCAEFPRRIRVRGPDASVRTKRQRRTIRPARHPRHERACSLAKNFSLDMKPYVLPIGRAGGSSVQLGAATLDFRGPRLFDSSRFFGIRRLIQALD